MTTPVRAALYLRVSTGRQAENDLSIPDQRRQAKGYCASRGWEIVADYVEPGLSATDDRRPEFQRMIDAATTKPPAFDVILVHSFSRFFRDQFQLEFYVRRLAKAGVRLVSITQELGDDPMSNMIRQIMALFDEYQSKENAKHTLRAMKENARQGFWNGALPPIGYRIVEASEQRGHRTKKTLEIDPVQAETVRLIFRLAREGSGSSGPMGVKSIATHLNASGIRTRDGGRWGVDAVHKVLTRTTYTRRRTPKKASTLLSDHGRIERHIKPILGRLPVAAVTREDIEHFMHDVTDDKTAARRKTNKKRGLSNVRGGRGVASRTVGLFGAIFTYAVRHRMRSDNPVHGVIRPADEKRERRLSDDEYSALGKALREATAQNVWPAAVAAAQFLALTGRRRGEALALRWTDLDLVRRTAILSDTKTGRSLRPLPHTACAALPPRGVGELVFPPSRGNGAMTGFRKMWSRIAQLGGLSSDVTPHTLRHSFASVAADLGYSEFWRSSQGAEACRTGMITDDGRKLHIGVPREDFDRRFSYTSTGTQGRPPKSAQLIQREFDLRCEAHTVKPTLAGEATELLKILTEKHPAAEPPSVKTIKNNLRARHRQYLESIRTGPENGPKVPESSLI